MIKTMRIKKVMIISLLIMIFAFVSCGCDNTTKDNGPDVGDYITFGTYEQDNDLTNGKEDIEWLVLDKEDSKILLISKYALEYKEFDNSIWLEYSRCSLRKWLNNDFKNDAFTFEEQNKFDDTHNTGEIFLLSSAQADHYLDREHARCKYTEYACRDITMIGDREKLMYCDWWLCNQHLLSDGSSTGTICYVNSLGLVYENAGIKPTYKNGVRPALWIDLSK